jgi:hypothetical protein
VNLTEINQYRVPTRVVRETEKNLRTAGRSGMECFVLWSGVISGSEFLIRTAHVPRQTSYRLESGLMVRVEGNALHKLNAWLYKNKELLAVQVHAHPTEAFHSSTDDAYPIVTMVGSISIVAADFCRDGLFSDSTAIYKLDDKTWRECESPKILFQVKS